MAHSTRNGVNEPYDWTIERFFKRHFSALCRTVQKILPAGMDPTDIAQEAILRAHAVKELSSLDHPTAYIYKAARHIALDHVKKFKTEQGYGRQEHASGVEYFWGRTPEGYAHYKRSLQVLSRAVMLLPDKTRQAFILRKFHNMSYKEIATIMNISEKTVEKHISKGLVFCRNHFEINDYIDCDVKSPRK